MNLCKNEFMRGPVIILTLGLACLCAALPAMARTFTGGNGVTVNAPEGWTMEQSEPASGQLTLISPDQKCLVSIQVIPDIKLSSKEFSEFFSQGVNRSRPAKVGEDLYSFEAVLASMPLLVFTHAGEVDGFVLMEIGETDSYAAELRLIRASLRSDDSTVQKMLDALK